MTENKLSAKLFISGTIEAITGMHIGGSTTALDIGGIDLNVIKTGEGVPYIPGSSLKGKLRSLFERGKGDPRNFSEYRFETEPDGSPKYETRQLVLQKGENDKPIKNPLYGKPCSCGECEVCYIFGTAGDKAKSTTRLIVRDAFLDKCDFNSKKENGTFELELDYTEAKWENTIDRVTSKAENPRQVERVPASARFKFEMVYNLFNCADADNLKVVIKAMRLLEDDYLGGSGSRGYGQIEFQHLEFQIKTLSDYEGDNKRQSLDGIERKHLAVLLDADIEKLVTEIKKMIGVEQCKPSNCDSKTEAVSG